MSGEVVYGEGSAERWVGCRVENEVLGEAWKSSAERWVRLEYMLSNNTEVV